MGQLSFQADEASGHSRNRPETRSSRPELTGDPATDRALLELADILAEIAREQAVSEATGEDESRKSVGGPNDE